MEWWCNWKDFGSNAFSSKTKKSKKQNSLHVVSTLVDVIHHLLYRKGSSGSKSEKSSYESNLLQTVSKNGQEVITSLWQLEMPPAVPPSYLWHVE